ncbi:MAG: hypothetical protein ACRDY6_14365, partial [Acidimicrobiia bacterium]
MGPSTIFVGIIAPGQPGSTGPVSADSLAAPRPYTYTWVPLIPPAAYPAAFDCVDPFGGPGRPYALVVRDLSGAMVATEPRCVPLNPVGAPALPELPPVPTIGEIWRAALRDITRPALGINPRPTGLTGLETWLWYEGPSELGVSASIGAFTVTGTAHLREVTFDMGEGETVTATEPGSATSPAARYVYETKGTYEIVVTATWEADLVLSGPGLPARPTPIGSAVLRSSESYP